MDLVGRKEQRRIFDECREQNKSHFLVLYGRRRVGKTYLIRQHFENNFTFYGTGLANADLSAQLLNFHLSLTRYGLTEFSMPPDSWQEGFQRLITVLERASAEKKVVFLDELPWMDTPRSDFLSALEYFWNSWASARSDIMLLTCGSAASWMLDNLINNPGGLYNRVTRRIRLRPFTLYEVEQYLIKRNFKLSKYQIVQLYMAFGGIPYYLEMLRSDESVAQNIDRLVFHTDAPLRNEFRLLFKSLFAKSDRHEQIIKALASKKTGLTRKEIVDKIPYEDGGGVTTALDELEASDFIKTYNWYGKKVKGRKYQLIDSFTLFHYRFIEGQQEEDNYWLSQLNSHFFYTWAGNAFEIVCLLHENAIKKALGISEIRTSTSVWYDDTAQIDLLIDRADEVVNIIEIKYAKEEFSVSKKYAEELQKKIAAFIGSTKTKKAAWLVMLTTYGVKKNSYTGDVVKSLTMENLFVSQDF